MNSISRSSEGFLRQFDILCSVTFLASSSLFLDRLEDQLHLHVPGPASHVLVPEVVELLIVDMQYLIPRFLTFVSNILLKISDQFYFQNFQFVLMCISIDGERDRPNAKGY